MKFNKINTLSGWVAFLIAAIVYFMTLESTVSFWDCGEFIATAYKLEVAHSPGAPLFALIGRIFTLFASSPEHVAFSVNAMSGAFSAFTILFLFWTITHFAKNLINKDINSLTSTELITIMGAGFVGALAYTFSDTFWFSAVEAEVYAMSSFFTAIVFWAILKWEHIADKPHADRWLILIFYLMGLSIGAHLLNLLTIPAIIMLYYFKRYKTTLSGGIIAFLIGCVILGFLQYGVIQYIPIMASKFELFFVNNMGLPYNTGALFFLVVLGAIFFILIKYAKKTGKYLLHLGTLCTVFTVIGYSSYVATIIRSKADVPIDMVNPDNIMSMIPYLQREQFGSAPLVSGQYFNSRISLNPNGKEKPIYQPALEGKDKYVEVGTKPDYIFEPTYIFPRIWDSNKSAEYRMYLGLGENEDPTIRDNYRFFFDYQLNWMWFRYFMWNYSGRQNDLAGMGEARSGNWITGIKPIDKLLGRGDLDKMPDSLKYNKARNEMYGIPFILGLLGLIYHYKKNKKDTLIVGMLFFFTGIAIQLYINNTPNQPRERDYSYVSAYPYAIWIGIGVIWLRDILGKFMKGTTPAVLATGICLVAVPVLMASQEWDDHDRSQKTLARDHALNMLNSCDSNAILITYGDNDTYPLWYLQEIEGYRRDIRIINYNLLGTDWQNEQLLFKINDADAIPMIWELKDFTGDENNALPVVVDPRIDPNSYFEAEEVIKFFTSESNKRRFSGMKNTTNYIPTKNISVKVDRDAVIRNGLVSDKEQSIIPNELKINIENSNMLYRNDLAMLNIIAGVAKDGWKRPIYLTPIPSMNINISKYYRLEGLLYKFVPTEQSMNPTLAVERFTDLDKNLNLFMNTFTLGNADKGTVYYDEKNKLQFTSFKNSAAQFAQSLVDADRNADAVKVIEKTISRISEKSMPTEVTHYDRSALMFMDIYYQANNIAGAKELGEKVLLQSSKSIDYFNSLPERKKGGMMQAIYQNDLQIIQTVLNIANRYGDQESVGKWQNEYSYLFQHLAK